mmetsp:Transcript_1460/g.6546  ORF Transcript_1460/g.6546 Transcript_1460/m.6546 type:complete len:264 (-) Transcript_1460:127-918(-)
MLRETMGLAPSSAATDCVHRSASVGGLYAAFAAATQAATAGSIGSSSSSFLADSSFLSFPLSFLSAAAAATCLRASGNGSGVSPGFSSTVPTQAYRPNTTQLSNQSSRFSLSLLLTLRVKYLVVLLRTMVPSSLSLPRAPYSMYSTGFWVSSLAREPILPSLRCASCPGKMVMYRLFLTLDRLCTSLQSLRRRSLDGTSSRRDDGRTRESCRPSTAVSKISRLRLACRCSPTAIASDSLSLDDPLPFLGGIALGVSGTQLCGR